VAAPKLFVDIGTTPLRKSADFRLHRFFSPDHCRISQILSIERRFPLRMPPGQTNLENCFKKASTDKTF
jgi:hypothetical protein